MARVGKNIFKKYIFNLRSNENVRNNQWNSLLATQNAKVGLLNNHGHSGNTHKLINTTTTTTKKGKWKRELVDKEITTRVVAAALAHVLAAAALADII